MQACKLKTPHPVIFLFCIFEFIYWSGNGMFYSFYVPFMTQKGLSNFQIGFVLSVNALLLMITLPLWGVWADKLKSPKIVLAIMFTCSTAIMLFIPALEGIKAIVAGICIMAIFESGIVSIIDSYIVQVIGRFPGASYGSIRMWGSVGIVTSLALSAGIVSALGTSIVFYCYGICLVILLPVLKFLPPLVRTGRNANKLQLGELLLNYRYIALLVFVTLLFIPYRFSVSFLTQVVKHTNGDTVNLSISLLVSYISEFVFYFFSIYLLKRYNLLKVIFVSGAFFILRQLAFSLVQYPYQVAIVQFTQGPAYTMLTASTLLYIHKLAPEHLKSTAQAVGNAVLFGVSGIVSNVLGGYLIDNAGIVKTFDAGAVLSLMAVLAYAFFNYFTRAAVTRTSIAKDRI
jgi:MFS transporter, PPP family, 3-phenylpropionic acid transporter